VSKVVGFHTITLIITTFSEDVLDSQLNAIGGIFEWLLALDVTMRLVKVFFFLILLFLSIGMLQTYVIINVLVRPPPRSIKSDMAL
jgi:hypothetical protein